SEYLRRELEAKLPDARGKIDVVDSGVDLERFTPQPAPAGPPAFLCVGSLTERKNVLRLTDAFERLGRATLASAGHGRPRARPAARAAAEQHDVRTQAAKVEAILERAAASRVACTR